jgi:transposase
MLWPVEGLGGACIACMSDRKSYPSNLTDERWALIELVLTSWKARHPSASGSQGSYEMREIVNAILCQSRTGCQWEYLPHDLPPRSDDARPADAPAGSAPALPEHPAYQQILTAFADLGRPLRARDLCAVLDLPIASKNTENIRSKLKRLVSRGILIEAEPGLFAQPRP